MTLTRYFKNRTFYKREKYHIHKEGIFCVGKNRYNRYENRKPAVAFVSGFGLKKGAIASCVAHDSHNIIAVGCTDDEISKAVNLIVSSKGGISAVDAEDYMHLPLEIAGIMSSNDAFSVAAQYDKLDKYVKNTLGSTLSAPFMTLSFMALLVIPELKLSDKGLFDGKGFHLRSIRNL